jgi:hypothetical protein
MFFTTTTATKTTTAATQQHICKTSNRLTAMYAPSVLLQNPLFIVVGNYQELTQ